MTEAITKKTLHPWLLLTLVLCLVFDATLFLMAQESYREQSAMVKEKLSTNARNSLIRAEQTLNIYDRTLSGVAEIVSFRGGLASKPDLPLHRLLVRRQSITLGMRWIAVFNSAGQITERSLSFPAPNTDVSDRDYFRIPTQLLNDQLFVGQMIEGRINRIKTLPLSRAITNDAGAPIGVVATGVDPESLYQSMFAANPEDNQQLQILVNSGHALTCHPRTADCLTQNWQAQPAYQDLLASPALADETAHETAGQYGGIFAVAMSSGKYPIRIVGQVNLDQTLADWRAQLLSYGFLVLLANFGVFGLSVFALQQQQRRRQAMDELKATNQTLEERVAQRTAELRLSEQRALQIIASNPSAMLLVNTAGQIEMANEKARSLLRVERAEQIIGQSVEKFIPAALRERHARLREDFHAHPEPRPMLDSREIPTLCCDGSEIPLEIGLGPVNIAGIDYVIASLTDLALRKQAEQQIIQARQTAEAANAAKSQFLSNVGHEVRTPMNAILGFSDLLQETPLTAAQRGYLERLQSAAQSLLRIFNDILDYALIERGQLPILCEPFSPTLLLHEVSQQFASPAAAKALRLQTSIAPDFPACLLGDAERLRHVLADLVDNAIKFTESGEVHMRLVVLAKTPEVLQFSLEVSDTGIGIAPELLNALGNSLVQGDASLSRRFGGMGLGLQMSQQLLTLMGGKLHIDSALGQGTTVRCTLTLPIADTTAPAMAIKTESASPTSSPLPIDSRPEPAQPPQPLNPATLTNLLQQLAALDALLEHNKLSAKRNSEALRDFLASEALANTGLASQYAPLHATILKLKFREAQAELASFRRSITP